MKNDDLIEKEVNQLFLYLILAGRLTKLTEKANERDSVLSSACDEYRAFLTTFQKEYENPNFSFGEFNINLIKKRRADGLRKHNSEKKNVPCSAALKDPEITALPDPKQNNGDHTVSSNTIQSIEKLLPVRDNLHLISTTLKRALGVNPKFIQRINNLENSMIIAIRKEETEETDIAKIERELVEALAKITESYQASNAQPLSIQTPASSCHVSDSSNLESSVSALNSRD